MAKLTVFVCRKDKGKPLGALGHAYCPDCKQLMDPVPGSAMITIPGQKPIIVSLN